MSRKRYNIKIQFGDIVRRVLLSWLLAVALEYLLLPTKLRELSGLAGLAEMSFARVVVLTCALAALLTGISCFVRTKLAERWCAVAVFGLLVIAGVWTSASWAFLTACLLVYAVLAVFALYGWDHSPEKIAPKKARGACLITASSLV